MSDVCRRHCALADTDGGVWKFDPKMGACGTLYSITNDKRLNHRVHTIGGVLDNVCGALLKEFFKKKRERNAL